jgi:hypothetical protein
MTQARWSINPQASVPLLQGEASKTTETGITEEETSTEKTGTAGMAEMERRKTMLTMTIRQHRSKPPLFKRMAEV